MTTCEVAYTPYGAARDFMRCRDHEVIIAGPAETGKTLAACWLLHIMADKYPGAQLAIIRKEYTTMPGSVLQTFESVISGQPVNVLGGSKPERYIYPRNGSTIWVGGMDRPGKVLSSARDIIYVNQAEELGLPEWETLATRTTGRAGNMPYSQLIGDCNPAHPTHWILARAKSGVLTKFDSVHSDNPTLYDPVTGEITERGKRTMQTLDNLTGVRKMRLRHGIWAAPEGAIYSIYDDTRHKCKAFNPPELWPRVVAIDPVGAYIAALWIAFDPAAGVLHVYREFYQEYGRPTGDVASDIKALSEGEHVYVWVGGGPSERQARLDWQAYGVPLIEPPNIGVWSAIDLVTEMLSSNRLVIHDACPNLLDEIGSYRRKMDRHGAATEAIEDKDKYHGLDCLRYGVSWLAEPTEQVARRMVSPVRIGRY